MLTSRLGGGGNDDLRRFRRLAAAALIATFVLIVIGRPLMLLATIAVLAMAGIARLRGVRSRATVLAAAFVLLQVLLGALNVWLGKHAGLIVGHLTLATLLWGVVIWTALVVFEKPGRDDGARSRRERAGRNPGLLTTAASA